MCAVSSEEDPAGGGEDDQEEEQKEEDSPAVHVVEVGIGGIRKSVG